MMVSGSGVLQVVAILEQTRSSYLSTFLSLRKAIQQEAVVAEDNLKFLQCLEQPCRTLASATAKVHRLYTDTKFNRQHVALSSHTGLGLLQRGKQQRDNQVAACSLYRLLRLSSSCLSSQRLVVKGPSMDGKYTVMQCKGIACWLPADVTSCCSKAVLLCPAGHSQDPASDSQLRTYDLEPEPVLQHA